MSHRGLASVVVECTSLVLPRGLERARAGTTTGLGNVAARDLVARGARVIVLNRASDRETSSTDALRAVAANGGSIDAVECDLQRFQSVRTAADRVLELVKGRGLDVLCNNAGVMALPEQRVRAPN